MRWWLAATLGELVLIVVLVCAVIVFGDRLLAVPAIGAGLLTEQAKVNKLAELAGMAFGAGSIFIWAIAFLCRDRAS